MKTLKEAMLRSPEARQKRPTSFGTKMKPQGQKTTVLTSTEKWGQSQPPRNSINGTVPIFMRVTALFVLHAFLITQAVQATPLANLRGVRTAEAPPKEMGTLTLAPGAQQGVRGAELAREVTKIIIREDKPLDAIIAALRQAKIDTKRPVNILVFGGLGSLPERFLADGFGEIKDLFPNVRFIAAGRSKADKDYVEGRLEAINLPWHQEVPYLKADYDEAGNTTLYYKNKPVTIGENGELRDANGDLICKVDVVFAGVPTYLHLPLAKQWSQRGVVVAVEKPLSLISERDEFTQLATQHPNKIFGVDFFADSDALRVVLNEILPTAKIGAIKALHGRCVEPWDPMDEPRAQTWLYDPEQSGGGLGIDAAVHPLSMMAMVLNSVGKNLSDAKVVEARKAICDTMPLNIKTQGIETYFWLRATLDDIDIYVDNGKGVDTVYYGIKIIGEHGEIECCIGSADYYPYIKVTDASGSTAYSLKRGGLGYGGTLLDCLLLVYGAKDRMVVDLPTRFGFMAAPLKVVEGGYEKARDIAMPTYDVGVLPGIDTANPLADMKIDTLAAEPTGKTDLFASRKDAGQAPATGIMPPDGTAARGGGGAAAGTVAQTTERKWSVNQEKAIASILLELIEGRITPQDAEGRLEPVVNSSLIRGKGREEARRIVAAVTQQGSLEDVLAERGGFSEFSRFFRDRLEAVNGDPQVLAADFEAAIRSEARRRHKSNDYVRERVLRKLACIAQDPGAPFEQPPDSWHLIANYLYLRLEGNAVAELSAKIGMGKALRNRLEFINNQLNEKNLPDAKIVEEIALGAKKRFARADRSLRQRIRFNYDSLFFRDGVLYLSVDIMVGAEGNLADGVKSELLVSMPIDKSAVQSYEAPYQLGRVNFAGRSAAISLFDPLDFLKKNFMGRGLEAGLVSERDVYEAWQAEYRGARRLFEEGQTDEAEQRKHTLVRPSFRALNAGEAGRGFFRAIVEGNTVLVYHLVHTHSERLYTNMTGITAPANLIRSLFKEGMLGKVVWCFEADHNRPEVDSDEDRGYVMRVLDEIARSGVHSGVTIDSTALINKEGITPAEKYDGGVEFAREQLVYLREALVEQEEREPGSVFFPTLDRWYVELDLAVDEEEHTEAEMRYIAGAALRLREEFGCAVNVVPGIGFTHGATAADLNLELLRQLTAVNREVLGKYTLIASHAGSGLNAQGLRQVREEGAFAINKSTEFGNMLLAVLRDSKVASDRELYKRIWDRLFDEFKDKAKDGKPIIPEEERYRVELARETDEDYERPYDFNYDEREGAWIAAEGSSEWLATNAREWLGLRDKHGRLVFHNDLVWDISEKAWEEYARLVEMTYRNYQTARVMNAEGMLPVVARYLQENWDTLRGSTPAYADIETPFAPEAKAGGAGADVAGDVPAGGTHAASPPDAVLPPAWTVCP